MNKRILHLAVPSIISNITVPLLGLVDVAITGHMGEARYMAAIAVGAMVFNIMYWLFSFLRFGTGGMTAQAYGMAEKDGSRTPLAAYILQRALMMSMGIALLLIALQVPLFHAWMWFIKPEPELVECVRTYYNICIWGTPASLSLYVLNGWFVGMQNTRSPMYVSVIQNVVNIALSCLFVYAMHMKIEGVALGTVIAQWTGFLTLAVLALTARRRYVKGKECTRAALAEMAGRLHVGKTNLTLFIRTLFLIAVNMCFIQAGAKGGATILAVNSVLMQMFILYTYVMDGFAFAAEALCGRYHGATDAVNFRSAMKAVWVWSLGLTVLYTLLYALGGDAFLNILTDDAQIRSRAGEYLPWAILIPVCGVGAFVWDGVFVGITNTTGMLWGTFGGAVAFFLLYLLLAPYMQNHALWLAFNVYLLMRGVVQGVIFKRLFCRFGKN